MFTDFINRILGAERRSSTPDRLENAEPSVIVKKDSNQTNIPEKYKKDITALERYYDCELSSLTGLSVSLTLQEALAIIPRNRHRVDSYQGLVSFLGREYNIKLIITSNKTKNKED
ncbi:hypothetical protein GAX96_01140 [Phocaeicola vulgatus]|jgi:hypothetical protein|uniref:Uncharacterized protein n=1 Tax=Phocaeicola vulgatus TaxID=821 RepID=A0A6I1BXN7_PHOVU|nr:MULTISPECIES: hypothetical protein [Phocaeicola]MZU80822.1 hypothetical protein [Escherichia coli]KAB3559103.1 hypothetical protein GAY14_02790 [Phocaeicola vulgatus]KAB3559487.1 hypothetical protein GAX95_00655 [Phocaeicola vulgatus]KAB3560893.1 hypothetical protein GAY65_02790 [Phocaeicola vulgatus]KAB3571081.1 hypothetical protein GAX92_01140 [Phocaeicola vulgatus]